MLNMHFFTSESVTEGHPDKVCDQISDAILDYALGSGMRPQVAVETLITRGHILVAGEITDGAITEAEARWVVRDIVAAIGYDPDDYGIDVRLSPQSKGIHYGVHPRPGVIGAGDQGMMFGYARADTPDYMPLPIWLAHKLARRLAEIRKNRTVDFLLPDGKVLVTVEYDNLGAPVRVTDIVVSTQHKAEVQLDTLYEAVHELVVKPFSFYMGSSRADNLPRLQVNPIGKFLVGGPDGDTGLTGRKIIVDTYGGMGRHGGGAFSGKDPTKVDRSAAYFARQLAVSFCREQNCREVEVQLAYVIGAEQPISVSVDLDGTPLDNVDEVLAEVDLSPSGIIRSLNLWQPQYLRTAAYGHFGRDFPWELNCADIRHSLVRK